MCHGASETSDTFGALFNKKTPEKVLKRAFLDRNFDSNMPKKRLNRPENHRF